MIGILVMMTAVVLLNQNDNKARSEVEAAARMIAAQLRALQNDALSGKMLGAGSENIVCNAGINFVNNADNYIVYYEKNCNNVTGPERENVQTVQLKKVRISVPSSGAVFFSTPVGKVDASGIDSNRISLVSTRGDSTVQASVCISDSGNIQEVLGETCPL